VDQFFSHLTLSDVHRQVIRNIISIESPQDLFDDLTDNPDEWALAQHLVVEVKPQPFQSRTPLIHRPFESAQWRNAIGWPFKNWQASRFSDGSFGIWYGCDSVETSVYETAYHWFNGLLTDAGFDKTDVVGERQLYDVACDAALLDLQPQIANYAGLTNKTNYSFTQSIGARLHREGHPGLVTASVRRATGQNYVVLNPNILSNPQLNGQLTYRLEGQHIVIERLPGVKWLEIATHSF
jgi:hypothetical protein